MFVRIDFIMRCDCTRDDAKVQLEITTEQPILAPSTNLDWVKKENMTPEQQSKVAKFCCGAYIEPEA